MFGGYHEFLIFLEIIWTSDVYFYMKTKFTLQNISEERQWDSSVMWLNSPGNREHRTFASNVLCWPVKRFLWRNWFCEVCNTYTFLFVSPRVPIICRINNNLTNTCSVCSIWIKGTNVPHWHTSVTVIIEPQWQMLTASERNVIDTQTSLSMMQCHIGKYLPTFSYSIFSI